MCQSYKKKCVCNQKTAEIFFGKMVLDEKSVAQLYCPKCSRDIDTDCNHRVWDNNWVLELDMDVIRTHANSMGASPSDLTARLKHNPPAQRKGQGPYGSVCIAAFRWDTGWYGIFL